MVTLCSHSASSSWPRSAHRDAKPDQLVWPWVAVTGPGGPLSSPGSGWAPRYCPRCRLSHLALWCCCCPSRYQARGHVPAAGAVASTLCANLRCCLALSDGTASAVCALPAWSCTGPSRRRSSHRLAVVELVLPLNSPTHRVTTCLGCLIALLSRHHCPTDHTPLSPWRVVPGALACPISVDIPSLTNVPLLPPPRSCPHAAVPSSCLGWSALSRGHGPRHCSGSTPSPSKSPAQAPSLIPHVVSSIGS